MSPPVRGLSSGQAGGTGREAILSGLAGLQVRVLELEKTLEAERVRLGELRKQHYVLAGAVGTPSDEDPGRPSAAPRSGASKKPPLAQKPSVAPRQDHQVPASAPGQGRVLGCVWSVSLLPSLQGTGPWGLATSYWRMDGGKGKWEAGRLIQGTDAGDKGEVGCVGAWPRPLSRSPLDSRSSTKRTASTRLSS